MYKVATYMEKLAKANAKVSSVHQAEQLFDKALNLVETIPSTPARAEVCNHSELLADSSQELDDLKSQIRENRQIFLDKKKIAQRKKGKKPNTTAASKSQPAKGATKS